MPTYQYACTACDHRFDAVQSFSDPSLTVCPVCSGALRKVFSSVGIVFKGSGFYRTDSRAGATVAKGEAKVDAGNGSAGSSAGAEKGSSTGDKATSGSSSGGSSSGSSSGGSSSGGSSGSGSSGSGSSGSGSSGSGSSGSSSSTPAAAAS